MKYFNKIVAQCAVKCVNKQTYCHDFGGRKKIWSVSLINVTTQFSLINSSGVNGSLMWIIKTRIFFPARFTDPS